MNLLRQLRLFHLFLNSQVKPQALKELKKQAEQEIILVENYKAYEMNEFSNEFAYRPRERRLPGTNLEHISDLESSLERGNEPVQLFSTEKQELGTQRSFIVPPDGQKQKYKKHRTMPAKRVVRDQ